MRYSNLHTHTVYSDGLDTIEKNVLSAIDKNMVAIGFSDHSYTPCDSNYCMKEDKLSEYIEEINRIKEKYKNQIEVYAGLELDYRSNLDVSSLDYVIASVHYGLFNDIIYQFDHSKIQQLNCLRDECNENKLDFAKTYYETVINNVIKTKPLVVGHFDVLTKFGLFEEPDDRYIELSVNSLKEVLKYCKYIEVNTSPLSRKQLSYPFPQKHLIIEGNKNGAEFVLSSDSHNKDGLIAYFDETVDYLKKSGVDHINIFENNTFRKNKI